jgi:Putative peptidoglycan binding domain
VSATTWDAVLQEFSREIGRRGTQPLQFQAPPRPEVDLLNPLPWLQGLLERMTQAERQLELAPLPAGDTSWGEEVRPGNREHNLRKNAVRARLELLGYSPGVEGDSSTLRQAVLRFQQDAGLDVDGWVGRQTWGALDEFITLEPPLQLEHWYPIGGVPCPALIRAMALRLRMLGFEAPLTDRMELLTDPLAAFRSAALGLGMPAGPEAEERQVIALLFDDELLFSIAARGLQGRAVIGALNLDEPETDPPSRMLRRMVRGELWLQGYNVGDLRGSTQGVQGQTGLADGLRAYWSHRKLPPGETIERRSKLIDPVLFEALLEDHRALPDGGAKEHEHVSSFVLNHLEEFREAWERTIPCRPVFFIWDGVKRGGQWLRKQIAGLSSLAEVVGRGLEYAKTFVWNMVRYVFQQGSQIFSTVRRAIAALIHGVQPFLDGGIRVGQGEGRVECQIALNGSLGVFIGNEATPESGEKLGAQLDQMSRCLTASAQILAEILRVELKLLRGPVGWMSLLSGLVKDVPRWRAYLAQVAELPDLPAPELQTLVGSPSGPEFASVSPPRRNWRRRLVLMAAGVLLVSGVGLAAYQFGVPALPTEPKGWLWLVGVGLVLPGLLGLAFWALLKRLGVRLGL